MVCVPASIQRVRWGRSVSRRTLLKVVVLLISPKLGGEKYIFPADDFLCNSLLQGCSNLVLILVNRCTVDVTVSCSESFVDRMPDLTFLRLPGSQANEWYAMAAAEKD